MITEKISLNDPKRFKNPVNISSSLIDKAIDNATGNLLHNLKRLTDSFTPSDSLNYIYAQTSNDEWTCGMNTGIFHLAYELTGNKKFYNSAKTHLKTYRPRFEQKVGLRCHDVGFVFTPSCVADYKITGNIESRELSLEAAKMLLGYFSEKGKFIKRLASETTGAYRTLVDTMMNLPLLFWAGEETGDKEYTQKAIMHYKTTEKYLIRSDGSSYHHYQFNPETLEPERGLTYQGYSDESCWSRGHSWLVYGFPIAYGYTKDESIFDIHRGVTYYFLNHLPQDYIPYWDFTFTDGDDQPRDSSAAAIAVCGLLEMLKYLTDDNPDKEIFKNAADLMMKSLIENYSNSNPNEDGLINRVTHALPLGRGIDERAIYGDYFYLEALIRYKNPAWKKYW